MDVQNREKLPPVAASDVFAAAPAPVMSVQVCLKVAAIAGLMAMVFWPSLRRLWDKTNPFDGEANWGHAIVVPLIGLYYLYINREELLLAEVEPVLPGKFSRQRLYQCSLVLGIGMILSLASAGLPRGNMVTGIVYGAGIVIAAYAVLLYLLDWGLASLLLGLGIYAYGIWPGQNDYLKDFGMVVTLFGVVMLLAGWAVIRVTWFPIVFLICAIPWPPLVYSWIAGPLQELAADVAVWTLQFTGVNAIASGTKIYIAGFNDEPRTLNVAEACAGLRSLMTFVTVGAAVAFLSSRPMWQKIVITLFSIPIAIFCNVCRVAGQGLLDHYISQQLSESFAHQFVGMIMLIPAFFLILLVGYVLDRTFLEEVNRRDLADEIDAAGGNDSRTLVVAIPRWKKQRPGLKAKPGAPRLRLRSLNAATAVPPPQPQPKEPK